MIEGDIRLVGPMACERRAGPRYPGAGIVPMPARHAPGSDVMGGPAVGAVCRQPIYRAAHDNDSQGQAPAGREGMGRGALPLPLRPCARAA